MATVQLIKAATTKLRIAAGPATSMAAPEPRSKPVPMEPPTATMAICPAESWWRRPSSWMEGADGMQHHSKKAGIAQIRRRLNNDSLTDTKLASEGPHT